MTSTTPEWRRNAIQDREGVLHPYLQRETFIYYQVNVENRFLHVLAESGLLRRRYQLLNRAERLTILSVRESVDNNPTSYNSRENLNVLAHRLLELKDNDESFANDVRYHADVRLNVQSIPFAICHYALMGRELIECYVVSPVVDQSS
jgi:hypothetical protein